MADSNITKKALASALKELMEEEPFAKISVADICSKCEMNRKSFYYHFKDKYDLVNWIFDVEFIRVVEEKKQDDIYDLMLELCEYFYDNKKFYRNALQIKGQNSFEEHFIELMIPILEKSIRTVLTDEEITDFHINFCIDAFLGAIKRWLVDKNEITPKEFVTLLESCMHMIGASEYGRGKRS